MSDYQVALPPKLIPVFQGRADVRGAYGGRGSAKTRSFAKMIAVNGMRYGLSGVKGILLCARQYMNSLDDSSLEECKRAIEDDEVLAAYYELGDKYIKSRDGNISFAFAGLDRNIGSIKSKGRILICWVDEAEPVTEDAFSILVPTLREENEGWNAELWVTWNPRRKNAAVELRYRNSKDPLIKIVQMNWRDNPKFPAKLERERQRDLSERPDQYPHIWEGEFVSVIVGAYYSKDILAAKEAHRIGPIGHDPLMTYHAFVDIGGTGRLSDAFAMWIWQIIGKQVRALDYYEAVGQPLGSHLSWLNDRGYLPKRCKVWLPHDGATHDRVFTASYESAFMHAQYDVEVVPNQGRGAAKARIEAGHKLFPSIWFNDQGNVTDQPNTNAGLAALGWYHEKKDDERGIGLGPEHDWASHGADAFGLGCVVADKLMNETTPNAAEFYRAFKRA